MGRFAVSPGRASARRWSPFHRSLLFNACVIAALIALGVVRAAPAGDSIRADFIAMRGACECATASRPDQCAAQSANFVVRSFVHGPAATDVAKHCERICAQLRREVFASDDSQRWQPRCVVVLHHSRSNYLAAVGRGGTQTVGSSNVTFGSGRVTGRRIDLLATDFERGLAALPHELVHVLFADAFPTTAPPKWAEEGFALLLDPPDKQSRHRRDLDDALQTNSTLPLHRLLSGTAYPAAAQRATFYAQSLSLVEYLTEHESPAEFIRFVKISHDRGHEFALRDVYGLDIRTLESGWLESARAGS